MGPKEWGNSHPQVFVRNSNGLLQRNVDYRLLASRCHFPFVDVVPSFSPNLHPKFKDVEPKLNFVQFESGGGTLLIRFCM